MNIDLQLSGHTHHGQIWPLNYITKAIYTLSWGYKKIGNTHFYVSCGYGTWGPPVRLGNRPEIVLINIKFEDWENVGTRITQMQRICADLQ
jgi:predicted MPP superfamily phosphohydrolase